MHVVVNILHACVSQETFYVCFVSNSLAYIIIPQNKGKVKISWGKKLTTTCIKNHDSLTAVHVSLRCCVKFPQVQYIDFSQIGQFFWKLSPFWLTCTGEHFNLSVMFVVTYWVLGCPLNGGPMFRVPEKVSLSPEIEYVSLQ